MFLKKYLLQLVTFIATLVIYSAVLSIIWHPLNSKPVHKFIFNFLLYCDWLYVQIIIIISIIFIVIFINTMHCSTCHFLDDYFDRLLLNCCNAPVN